MITVVIIQNYDDIKMLKACIKSVDKQTTKAKEIIVVVRRSTNIAEILEKFGCKVIYDDTLIFGKIFKSIVSQAQGDIIVFTESDCIPDQKWLEKITASFEKKRNIAAVTGPIIPLKNTKVGKALSISYKSSIFRDLIEVLPEDWNRQEESYVKHTYICNVAYKRVFLHKLTQEEFNIIENTDVDNELQKLGYKLLFSPEATVYHKRNQNHLAFRRRVELYARKKVMLFRGYHEGLKAHHMLPLIYLFLCILFAVLSIANRIFSYTLAVAVGLYLLFVLTYSLGLMVVTKQRHLAILVPILLIEGHLTWIYGLLAEILRY